jgi:hypothetical protein
MTKKKKTTSVRAGQRDAAVAAGVPDTAHDADTDMTLVTVGTFAAGQSAQGRYAVAAEAPQSSFATGQADEETIDPRTATRSQRRA